jgi:hypothetical protein
VSSIFVSAFHPQYIVGAFGIAQIVRYQLHAADNFDNSGLPVTFRIRVSIPKQINHRRFTQIKISTFSSDLCSSIRSMAITCAVAQIHNVYEIANTSAIGRIIIVAENGVLSDTIPVCVINGTHFAGPPNGSSHVGV